MRISVRGPEWTPWGCPSKIVRRPDNLWGMPRTKARAPICGAATAEYIWGDKTLRTIHWRTCGCVTHWEPLQPTPGCKHGVNLGNFDPKLIAAVRVRRFDGADRWTFIDD